MENHEFAAVLAELKQKALASGMKVSDLRTITKPLRIEKFEAGDLARAFALIVVDGLLRSVKQSATLSVQELDELLGRAETELVMCDPSREANSQKRWEATVVLCQRYLLLQQHLLPTVEEILSGTADRMIDPLVVARHIRTKHQYFALADRLEQFVRNGGAR